MVKRSTDNQYNGEKKYRQYNGEKEVQTIEW